MYIANESRKAAVHRLLIGCIGGLLHLLVLGLLVLGLLVGCTSLNVNLLDYPEAPMERAPRMPSTQELKGDAVRVAISAFEIAGTGDGARLAHQASLPAVMATAVETQVGRTGAKIVDRRDAEALMAEVLRIEEAGGVYRGEPIANYVIHGTVDGANIGKRFQEQQQWTDKDGKVHVIPPKCQYASAVSGRLRIYKMPSLAVERTVPLSYEYQTSEDARSSNDCTIGAQQYPYLAKAAEAAINNGRGDFLNLFAAKGYVLNKRTDGKTYLFKISIGTNKRLQKGLYVDFFRLEDVTHLITGQTTTETRKIASGRVSSEIAADHAWVLVKDDQAAERIRLGDAIRIRF